MSNENFRSSILEQGKEYEGLISASNLSKMKSQVVFLAGEDIQLWDRKIVIRRPEFGIGDNAYNDKYIIRGRLMRIVTHEYGERRMDFETLRGDEKSFEYRQIFHKDTGITSMEAVLPKFTKMAGDSASELVDAYKNRGIVWLDELAGISDQGLFQLETLLFGHDGENLQTPENLIEFQKWLDEIRFRDFSDVSDPKVKEIISSVVKKLGESIKQSFTYQTAIVDRIETELFNRRHNANAQGIMSLDDKHEAYFKQLKRVPQDRQISDIAEAQRASLFNALALQSPVKLETPTTVETPSGVKCPLCAAPISAEAVKCPICHEWIDDDAEQKFNERRQKRGGNGKQQPRKNNRS